ncbi:MAG: glycoside hydrolase family 92 protein [Bacteroidetes bacterium]|nr:MAG: glycoside hydrolase family 92 protein [Bacteroidota bacterium]
MNPPIYLLAAAGLLWAILGCSPHSQPVSREASTEPVDLVAPLVDAANSRWFFFNSATRPFGMVNLSPDMGIDGAWDSGYRYHRDTIRCFSHIHAWQLSGIPVLPTTGNFKGHLGPDHYGSRYSHKRETVKAGYHQVFLSDYGINAELTATPRVGFHRYTFPEAAEAHILLDFSTFLGPSDTQKGYARKVSDTEIAGYALMAATRRRPKATFVYYVIEFDQPFERLRAWQNGQLLGEVDQIEGEKTGVYVSFATRKGEQRLMKVGISYVSTENARLNLQTELPHWQFERVVAEARTDWNEWLGKIRVEGGTHEQQRRFYTDLWHALQGRRIISDVNGQYCDMTGPAKRTGQIPLDEQGKPRFQHYNSDSFWGAQWTLNPLWQLVYPRVAEEFVNSMLLMYQDGGLIPRGPSGGNYTFVMTGASTTPFIVGAYMKGIRGFDVELAYEGMRKNHLPGGIMAKAGYEHHSATGGGLNYYLQRGYIPHPLPTPRRGFHEDGAGQTLEYAYQDWCLSQMAEALGKEADARMFAKRAMNYKNLWKEDLGWMWVRDSLGKWQEPVDILRYDHGWVEGNAAQFTWFVPQDVQGLIELMGGKASMVEKLNYSFEQAQTHGFVSLKSRDKEENARNRRTYINYGNQPSMQTAFLFNYAGAPWLTQYWSRRVTASVYEGISPERGYSGDEDQGLMGALAVLMKMGLFSMRGGAALEPVFEIGSPIFDKITLQLDPDFYTGGEFVIEAVNNGPEAYYIQSAQLDGHSLDKAWFYHKELTDGGRLLLQMGTQPNKKWGVDLAPPSVSRP